MNEPAVAPPTGPRALGQESVDRLALGAAGLACGVYLLHSLPSILFPTGILASVLTLMAGVLLGLAGAGGALALAFYQVTHQRPGAPAATRAAQLQPSGRARRRGAAAAAHAATLPGPAPPHAISLRGEFSGIVYTAPASAWRREDTPGNWPPTCEPSHPFRAWEATVSQGTLVLRPLLPPPGAKPPSPPRGTGGGGAQQDKLPAGGGSSTAAEAPPGADQAATAAAPAAEPAPAPAKVGIPLEGCTVELVVEGLNGRSEWIRRAPLLVAHPQWNLLEGEPAFYLWADDPASKQQWLHALGWWCQDSERLAAIDAMYAAYCQSMRDRSLLEYPEHVPQLEGGGEPAGGAAGEAAQVAGGGGQPAGARRGWKGWGNRVQTMRRKMQRGRSGAGDFPGVDGELAAGGSVPPSPDKRGSLALRASPAKPSLLDAAATSAEMSSLDSIIEARWMQSRKIQVPPAVSEAVTRSRHGSVTGSLASSPRAIMRSATSSAGGELAGGMPRSGGSSAVGSLPGEGFATPRLGSSPTVRSAGMAAFPVARNSRSFDLPAAAQLSSAAAAAALPPGSPLQSSALPPPPPRAGSAPETEQPAAAEGDQEAAAEAQAAPAPDGGMPLPEGLPPLLSPDYVVNAFVARLAFDLLRRPDFTEYLRARIQRQLGRMQRPEYIQTLEVVGVDAGGAAPSLRNLRALPQPEAAIWPQVMFDMRYQGAFTVTIEMKVDFREAGAWGRLDQALTRLAQGKPRGSSGGGGPPHAASAPSMSTAARSALEEAMYGEEGGEEEAPGSPQSSAASSAGGGGERGGGRKPRGMLGGFRQSAANKLRQLAENTAMTISRRWVLKHASGIRSLTINWPGYDQDNFIEISEGLVWSLQLTVASVLTALAPSLQRLHHTFTCFIPWADALLPLGAGGGGALRSLHLDRCHLASLAGLGAMGGSLTELSISLCEGFADSHVLPGLPATLRALPLLESLTLDTLCSDPVPDTLSCLTRLTSLSLVNVALNSEDGFKMPDSCSTLTRLASLRIDSCGVWEVPEAVEHFTGLRTLLLGSNELGMGGVPPGLSALTGLESLDLSCNILSGVPRAFHALQHLTSLNLSGCGLHGITLAPGPYLSSLRELNISRNHVSLPPGNYSTLRRLVASASAPASSQAALGPLPVLPMLRQLDWRNNAKLNLEGGRLLLQKAPTLEELLILKTSAFITPPAAKFLREAGVELEHGAGA